MLFLPVRDEVPSALAISRAGTSASILIPLTISEDERIEVAFDIRLWPGYWHGHPVHEFKFAIVVRDRASGSIEELFDRDEAAPYVASVRHLVMPCVTAAAKALVAAVSPAIIYRATYLSQPPAQSLPKHGMITDILLNLGYELWQEGMDSHHRRYWLMLKSGDA